MLIFSWEEEKGFVVFKAIANVPIQDYHNFTLSFIKNQPSLP